MKTTETIKEINRENLYSFYVNLGCTYGFTSGTIASARYISNVSMSWPSYILGGGKMVKNSLLEIFYGMKEGTLPYFWIRPMEDDPEFEDFAGEHGIRKINLWRGMHMRKNSLFKLPAPDSVLVFEEIKTQRDLRDWLQVVNKEIMSHYELEISNFLNVLHNPAFRFFRVTKGKKTLSTILMHKRSTETGIYLVSTILNERGKGLGSWITASAIDLFISEGCKDFVLHATPLGYPVYLKLGFKECCQYGIFWMLGKR
jgi:hypothetical protein